MVYYIVRTGKSDAQTRMARDLSENRVGGFLSDIIFIFMSPITVKNLINKINREHFNECVIVINIVALRNSC